MTLNSSCATTSNDPDITSTSMVVNTSDVTDIQPDPDDTFTTYADTLDTSLDDEPSAFASYLPTENEYVNQIIKNFKYVLETT